MIRHEPENTQCACGCQLQRIAEDVSEKLDCTPGVSTLNALHDWMLAQRDLVPNGSATAKALDYSLKR